MEINDDDDDDDDDLSLPTCSISKYAVLQTVGSLQA